MDSLEPQIHGVQPERSPLLLSIRDKVDFRRGSVTSRTDLVEALDGIGVVVHFAAETGTGQSMYAIQHYTDVNIGGTALLLDIVANDRLPIDRFVVASSRAIYGEGRYRCGEHGVVFPQARSARAMLGGDFEVRCPYCAQPVSMEPTDEDCPARPASVYGITKLNQEQMTLTIGQSLGISALALRYQNVYGPGQSLTNPYTGILSIFSTRMLNGSDINIFEDGLESRDFVFIDDAIAASVAAVEDDSKMVGAFNVGSGVATSVLTVARNLQILLGTSVPIAVSGKFRVGDIRHNVADLRRVRAALGYAPKVSFSAGLRQFVEWVKGEGVQEDRFERSIRELEAKGLYK
jgi:dTDP-L-rhamnose 4-epimerase